MPLFWDQNFCIKSPIALGYTRGHFSALVPMEPFARIDPRRDEPEDVRYLPLMDCESKLFPIHFLTQAEVILTKCTSMLDSAKLLNFTDGPRRGYHETMVGCVRHRWRLISGSAENT